jgi:hypothetical protein
VVHGVDLAPLQARGRLQGGPLLTVFAGVVAELLARLEVLYADVWMVGFYAPVAGCATYHPYALSVLRDLLFTLRSALSRRFAKASCSARVSATRAAWSKSLCWV